MSAFFKPSNNVSNQIKRAIGYRILLCFILSLVVVCIIAFNEINDSLSQIEKKIAHQCQSLTDFAVSQVLIDNTESIQSKLDELNANPQATMKITWKNAYPNKQLSMNSLHFDFPLLWKYFYPIKYNKNKLVGIFLVEGSLLKEKNFFYQILSKLAYLLLFFISIFLILFPLAKRIPQKLFIVPIHHILSLLKNKENNDLKNMSEEIQEISEQITLLLDETKQLSEQAAMGKLSAKVAHDIASPLMSMTRILKEISIKISSNEREVLEQSIQSVRDIANNLLNNYVNKNKHIIEYVDDGNKERYILLFSLIESVISQKRYEWKKNSFDLDFELDEQAKLFWVFAAPNNIKRILSNLLNNSYESLEEKRKITISLSLLASSFNLSIKDTGRGIASNKIEAVLKGKSYKKSGHGLGLSGAKEEMEKLGGSLNLLSKINMGTEVILTFPLYDSPIWFPESIRISSEKLLLILDDDPSIHSFWVNHLYPITCNHFYSSHDVFEWIERHTEKKDLTYLFDYELQANDLYTGLEALEQLRAGFNGYLITHRAEELEIQNRCAKAGIWLIPKILVNIIPLEKI